MAKAVSKKKASKKSNLDKPFYPIIPLKGSLILPGTASPILLGRKSSILAAEHAIELNDGLILLLLQKDETIENVISSDLYDIGVLARITNTSSLPNQIIKIMVEATGVLDVKKFSKYKDLFITAQTESRYIEYPSKPHMYQKVLKNCLKLFSEFVYGNPDIPNEVLEILDIEGNPTTFLLTITSYLATSAYQKQDVLESPSLEEMALRVETILVSIRDMSKTKMRLQGDVRQRMQKNQREFMLSEELRLIHEELGQSADNEDPELKVLEKKVLAKNMPKNIEDKALEELSRLPMLPQSSPEYSVVRSYIEWFLSLPFNEYTSDSLDLRKVRFSLNKHHYGLEKVKDRILEHVAVLKLSKEKNTPILCLVGPPGTGKTTLAKSISDSLNRNYIRISLGGVRDESEIRGHRRTYIGSMPGRIVHALRKAKSMNPLILLDEIDKMSGDFRGDPASALLEVLDAEQNFEFSDHYLEVGVDLSRVMFIATANDEGSIPAPLRDRMEVVRLSGYYTWEKLEIAKKHLFPQLCERNGISKKELILDDGGMEKVIRDYTREAGVRELSRSLDSLCRKRAVELVSKKKYEALISANKVKKYLGAAPFSNSTLFENPRCGLVTGLAWTSFGGVILQLECTLLSGKGGLFLTGTLGDVMKESARIALTLTRERLAMFNVDPAIVRKTDIHIHLPEGAIPKDGPSAGVGLTLLLLSAFTRQVVPAEYAFTGEVSLTGQVHAIGGLPEKVIAAKEAGVKKVFIPEQNLGNLDELPAKARKGLSFVKCKHIDDVVKHVFKVPKKPRVAVKSKQNK